MSLALCCDMLASRLFALTGLVVLASGFAGCTQSNEHVNRLDQIPSSAEGNLKGAVSEIVTARCNREDRCKNIGTDRTYETRDACTSKLHGSTESDINVQDCKHGVDRPKLHRCLDEIRSEDCGNPIDTLSRVAACRTAALCTVG